MSAFNSHVQHKAFWQALAQWHAGLELIKGNRAELRRAKTPEDVYISAAFQRGFAGRMANAGFAMPQEELERLAPAIGLLAHVTDPAPGRPLAVQLAKSGKGSPEVRDARFRRLVSLDYGEDLYLMLLRLIRYLGGAADMQSLVRGVFFWGDNVKKEWTKLYYTNA